jgi:hypothetical protein
VLHMESQGISYQETARILISLTLLLVRLLTQMIYKIQVVTVSEDGCQETLEIACMERTDLKPETLGLTLAEGKMILNDLQQIVVERQVSSSLLLKQACPDCGQRRCSKGNHMLSLRTVSGSSR